jgi:hypothetical protein
MVMNNRTQVRYKIAALVRWGVLERPKSLACFHCGKSASGYHHFKGYLKENWLRVLPLCDPCHYMYDIAINLRNITKVSHLGTLARRKKFFRIHKGHDTEYYVSSSGKSRSLMCHTCRRRNRNKLSVRGVNGSRSDE